MADLKILHKFFDTIRNIKGYIRVSNVDEVSRRYFVLNTFDGAITALGAVIGSYTSGIKDPRVVTGLMLSLSIAMGASGFSGAYLAERAERSRRLKELEEALFTRLENTLLDRASRFATLWAAIVDGSSPAVAASIASIPFIASSLGLLEFSHAVFISLILMFSLLFILGIYLGMISRDSLILNGFKATLIGVATTLICMLLGGF